MHNIRFLTNHDHAALTLFFEVTNSLLRTRTTQRFIDCIYEHLDTPFENLRVAGIFNNGQMTALCIGCTTTFLWKEDIASFPEEYRGIFTIPWMQGLPNTMIPRKDKSKIVALVLDYFYNRGLKTVYFMVPWPGNADKNDVRKINAVLRSNGQPRNIRHNTASVRAVLYSSPDQKRIPKPIQYLFFHNTSITYPQAIIRLDIQAPFFHYYEKL